MLELEYKESWALKIDAFELWCWRRLLRVLWTARRSNQSILKEISPECSLEGLMLKLKLQFWPPDVKSWLIWKDPDAGKDWGQEEMGTIEDEMVEWHHRHNVTWVWVNSGSWWWIGRPGVLWSMGSQRVRHDWVTELNWDNPGCSSHCNSLNLITSAKSLLSCKIIHVQISGTETWTSCGRLGVG